MPEAKYALIFIGKLSETYTKMLDSEDIEIWDSAFLSKEFKEQIENPPSKKNLTYVQKIGRMTRISLPADEHVKRKVVI